MITIRLRGNTCFADKRDIAGALLRWFVVRNADKILLALSNLPRRRKERLGAMSVASQFIYNVVIAEVFSSSSLFFFSQATSSDVIAARAHVYAVTLSSCMYVWLRVYCVFAEEFREILLSSWMGKCIPRKWRILERAPTSSASWRSRKYRKRRIPFAAKIDKTEKEEIALLNEQYIWIILNT